MKRVKLTDCAQTKKTVTRVLNQLLKLAGPEVKNVFDIEQWTIEGSVRCNVKVGQPDEVDIQIPLKIPPEDIVFLRKGTCWTNEDCQCGKHTKVNKGRRKSNSFIGEDCEFENKTIEIPTDDFGIHCVKINERSNSLKYLKKYPIIRHKNHLTPRSVAAFLKTKLKIAATKLNKKGESKNTVTVSRLINGPAIQVTITVPNKKYDIQVDVVSTLPYPMKYFNSKRTRIVKKLDELPKTTGDEAGTELCLVPKFDQAWKLSFSKFENNILDSFYDGDDSDDDDYDCKKDCLRLAKHQLLEWKKKDRIKLRHISSYLLKTLLFRALSKKRKKKDWLRNCFAERYLDMLNDFAECVSERDMQEFFNESVNLLENKSKSALGAMKLLIQNEIKSMKKITNTKRIKIHKTTLETPESSCVIL